MWRTVARRASTTTAPSWAITSILNSCVADFWPYRNRKPWCSDSTLASLGRPPALARGLAAFCFSLQETDRRSAVIFESLGWGNNLISFSAEGEDDAARAPAPFPHRSLVSAGVFLLGLDVSGDPHRRGALASGDPGRGALSYRRRGHAGLLRA